MKLTLDKIEVMFKIIHSVLLAVFSSMIVACSSAAPTKLSVPKNNIFELSSVMNQGSKRVSLSLGDKIIINTSSQNDSWWILYPGKNTQKKLVIDKYANQRQHYLSFNQSGEYRVTGIKKTSTNQKASLKRTLILVVN